MRNKKLKRVSWSSVWVMSILLAIDLSASLKSQAELSTDKPTETGMSRLLIGYQTDWATAGQLMETLAHTNIPKLYDANMTFRTFQFGPDINKAALDNTIDATSSGMVPTINLMAASNDWVSVCRLLDFPISTVARNGLGIKNFADLKGRKISVPFKTGAHLYLLQRLKENKVPVGTGPDAVNLIDLSPTDAITALKQGTVDAIATWEPTTTLLEEKGIARAFDNKRYIGLLNVRKSLVQSQPKQVMAVIKSLIEANLYVAKHRNQTDDWFASRSGADLALLKKIRVIEPNLQATRIEDISVQIKPNDLELFQQVADQMYSSKLLKSPLNIKEHVNFGLERQVTQDMLKETRKTNLIQLLAQK